MVFCSVLIINLRALINPQLNTGRSLLILLARVSHAPQRSFNSMSKPGKRQVIYLISISSNGGSIISWVFTFAFSTSLSSLKMEVDNVDPSELNRFYFNFSNLFPLQSLCFTICIVYSSVFVVVTFVIKNEIFWILMMCPHV